MFPISGREILYEKVLRLPSLDLTESLIKQWQRSKGKSVLLEAWSGPQGSRKLRFPDYVTMAQDGGQP